MGRVFSTEELQNGNFPEPGAHSAAGKYLLDQFFYIVEPEGQEDMPVVVDRNNDSIDPKIASAMVYGSTVLGTSNTRSDLDVLVNFYDYHSVKSNDEVFTYIKSVFTDTEARFNVPVEANVLPHMALWSPLEHNVDPLFARHLIDIQEQNGLEWSFNFPVDGLTTSASSRILTPEDNPDISQDELNKNERLARALAIRYASGKALQMVRALTGTDKEVHPKTMQRALELPAALGRKVVALSKFEKNNELQVFRNSDSRQDSFDGFIDAIHGMNVPNKECLAEDITNLQSKDKEYGHLVDSVIDGSSSPSEHEAWLQAEYETVLQSAYRIGQDWTEVMRNRLDVRDYEHESTEQQAMIAASHDSAY